MIHLDKVPQQAPNWMNTDKFSAQGSLKLKITRAVNTFIFTYAFSTPTVRKFVKLPKICILGHYITILLTARKILEVIAGFLSYKATHISQSLVKELGETAYKTLEEKGFIVKKVPLLLSGASYEGTVVVAKEFFNSSVCTVHARGINKCVEMEMVKLAEKDHSFGSYSIFVNGPSVGFSSGLPTSNQIPAPIQAAIQYAENELKAKSIIVLGHSFGGGFGIIGLARHLILMQNKGHIALEKSEENNKIRYLAISHCTFSDFISIAALTRSRILKPVFTLIGYQLDNVEASRIISEANVPHIVIQGKNGSDSIIPDAVSLATVLKQKEITTNKFFITSEEITHTASVPLPDNEQTQVDTFIRKFINKEDLLIV